MDYMESYRGDRAIAIQNSFLRRVYTWMALGLGITAVISLFVSASPALEQIFIGNQVLFFLLIIAELGMVVGLSAGINRISASTATIMFFIYSALNGLTFSFIFLVYTAASIASTFFITAGTFAAMSIYGYTTKRDLTAWRSFLFMGLIGVIIAAVVNIFLHSMMIYWIVTFAGVIVFVGLTAYDTQKIKEMAYQGFGNEQMEQKAGVIGALRLYLDFINLFLLLLRLFGQRR